MSYLPFRKCFKWIHFGLLCFLLYFTRYVRGEDCDESSFSSSYATQYPYFRSPAHKGSNLSQSAPSVVYLAMLNTYDNRVRPDFSGPPTTVKCKIKVISIDAITEVTMDYGMTIILESYWNDERLAYGNAFDRPFVAPSYSDGESFWLPDIFFSNEKKAYFHEVTVLNKHNRIYANGDIVYILKLSLVLSCPMNFRSFPMDKQRCTTVIESHHAGDNEINLFWIEGVPIELAPDISLPQYKFDRNISYKACERNIITNGTHSCIEFSFILVRELAFYVVQTYIPCSLLVLMSWVSFWIDITQAPARVSLGVTIILTMTTTTTGYGASSGLPKVSYTKAIDVWFDLCLGFVTCSLLEYAVVHFLWNRSKERKHLQMNSLKRTRVKLPLPFRSQNVVANYNREEEYAQATSEDELEFKPSGYHYNTHYRLISFKSDDIETGLTYKNISVNGKVCNNNDKKKKKDRSTIKDTDVPRGCVSKLIALNIDRLSRILFPVAFIIFGVIYWMVYKLQDDGY